MRPLRVAMGAVAGVTGGPATYALELAGALARLREPGFELVVVSDRPSDFQGDEPIPTIEVPLRSSWGQPWWDNVAVPRALRARDCDVYHGTKNALSLPFREASARVVTIHDLAVLAEPDTFSLAQRAQLHLHLRHAARSAQQVICVSEHAAGDVERSLGISRAKITVVPHGIGARFQPPREVGHREAVRRKYGVAPGGFLLAYVGTLQPRKRIDVAVAAVERLVARGLDVRLVIAGRKRPGFEPRWLVEPPSFVRLCGEIPSPELVDLLGAADVMVSPSSYEGFGLTFAEAMACGTPVVGVAVTSVPEVVGDGGILVAAPEAGLVEEALSRLLGDPELRVEKARAALRRAGGLSWERAARATLEVYRAAAAV